MPLSSGYWTLKDDIEAAYNTANDAGAKDDASPDDIITTLANDLGDAIHTYMETALVSTTVIVDPASMNAAGSPAATAVPTASYTTPGSGVGFGTISFGGGDVDTLKSDIDDAFSQVETDGKEDAADPDAIIGALSDALETAIDTFALTALVETDVVVYPGQVVLGYMAIAGTTTVPVPAVSITCAGSGEGDPDKGEGLS